MRVEPGDMLPHVTETDCHSEVGYVTLLRSEGISLRALNMSSP